MVDSKNSIYRDDYLTVNSRVWLKVLDPDSKKGSLLYGKDGDVIFAGVKQLGTSTYLIFDKAQGIGKRTQLESFSVNAAHVLYLGVLEAKEQA